MGRAPRWSSTAGALLAGMFAAAPAWSAPAPVFKFDDVERFFAVYDAAGAAPSAETLQRDYLDKGSAELAYFAKARRVDGARMAAAMTATPEVYRNARSCAARLPMVRDRVAAGMTRLGQLYPQAKFPPVAVLIGRARPVAIGDATGVYVSLETLCAWTTPDPDEGRRMVQVIAHEYVHVQQTSTGEDPGETVLKASLVEGAAEFLAELMVGSVSYRHLPPLVAGRERELERAFQADMRKPANGSAWLYNGIGTAEQPGDLGYWVGYRIVKAYYRNAPDKRAAIAEILQMTDAEAFLARSGWTPGMRL